MSRPECPESPDRKHKFTETTACDYCGSQAIIVDGEVLYCAHPKQSEYHNRTEPNVLFWGGRGSGKSMCGRWDAHLRALSHPGFKYCILRRTYPELQRSHLTEVPREIKKLGGYFHYTDRVAHYPNGSLGFFSHCATDADVLNLLSAEFHLMFFDEISTFEWEMFTKLAASVRVPINSGLTAMVRAATNPLGVSAEMINRYFVLKDITVDEDPDYNPNDWFEIHANVEDNPSLDQDQYRKRFSGLPSHVRKAWVDGEFALENALFEVHPTLNDKPYHVIHDIDLPKVVKSAQIYRVFDWGWFPDPAYCAWIAHLGNRFIVFNEKIWYRTIAAEIAREMKEEDARLGVTQVAITYCDPTIDINTGADIRTVKDIFEMNGIPMESSVNKRALYASHVHAALAEVADMGADGETPVPRLQMYVRGRHEGCPYLAKTLPLMRYNPKRPMEMDDHQHDHPTVALAYFLISSGAMEKRTIGTVNARPWMKQKKNADWILGRDNVRNP